MTDDEVSKIFMGVLAREREKDPLVGARVGARELVQRLFESLKDKRGVHGETLLAALGSLAGYACQVSVRTIHMEEHGLPENKAFVVVKTRDGNRYFFGDPLNRFLAEDMYSVWSLAAGQAQRLGCVELPDIVEIATHVASTLGGPDFGVPRLPEHHRPRFMPVDFVKVIWPAMFPVVQEFCPAAAVWPMLYALAIQQVMEMDRDAIDPCMALKLAMECAVPMSKIEMPPA
jgi:hypothetical protein